MNTPTPTPTPRSQTKPLSPDETKYLDELLERQMASLDIEDEPPPLSDEEERRFRLALVYLMSRHVSEFVVTKEWLDWIWSDKNS